VSIRCRIFHCLQIQLLRRFKVLNILVSGPHRSVSRRRFWTSSVPRRISIGRLDRWHISSVLGFGAFRFHRRLFCPRLHLLVRAEIRERTSHLISLLAETLLRPIVFSFRYGRCYIYLERSQPPCIRSP
jgi:hypothetical protein